MFVESTRQSTLILGLDFFHKFRTEWDKYRNFSFTGMGNYLFIPNHKIALKTSQSNSKKSNPTLQLSFIKKQENTYFLKRRTVT